MKSGKFKFGWRRRTVKGGSKSESDDIMPIAPIPSKKKGDAVNTKRKVFPNGLYK